MTDDSQIAAAINDAIRSLNRALEKAYDANITVEIDYATSNMVGRRAPLRIYNATISRVEFID